MPPSLCRSEQSRAGVGCLVVGARVQAGVACTRMGALEVGLGGQAIAEGGEGHGPDHALGEHMAMLVRSGRVSRPI